MRDPEFSYSVVDFCVGGTKVNKGDVARKAKSDGKATKFYILCNFEINALHFKMERETFNITQGFYTSRAFLLVSKSFYLIVCYSEIWITRVFEV